MSELDAAIAAYNAVWEGWSEPIDAGNVDEVRRAAMTAALSAKQDGAWQPIETAPKDGTKFMAWDSRTRTPWFVYWDGAKLHPNRPTLTHWRPNPAGPEQGRSPPGECL